jgi:hypothetical protein
MHQACQAPAPHFGAFFAIPAARLAFDCDWSARNAAHVILHPRASIHRSNQAPDLDAHEVCLGQAFSGEGATKHPNYVSQAVRYAILQADFDGLPDVP